MPWTNTATPSTRYMAGYAVSRASGIKHTVSDVWAAACAAHRINGGYIKESQRGVLDQETGQIVDNKKRNRDLMQEFLANPEQLLVDDVIAGEQVLNDLKKDLTWRALKGQLTDFDQSAAKVLAIEGHFDSQLNRLELAVVACLPASHERMQARQATEHRMSQTSGEYVAPVGHKAMINVEVINCQYSHNWDTHYITAVTDQNHAVLFSLREGHDAGSWLSIQGTVKSHRPGVTQLNRVRVL